VKLFLFLLVSVGYLLLTSFIWMQIELQCGMGPDSPFECNQRADQQGEIFAVVAIILYCLAVLISWRKLRTKVR